MSSDRITIPRASDKSVASAFAELGAKFGAATATVRGMAGVKVGEIQLANEPTGEWKALLDLDSSLIEHMQATLAHLTISYYRGGLNPPESKSPIYDEFVLSFSDGQSTPPTQVRLEIVAFLSQKMNRFELGRISVSDVSPEISQVLAIHQSNLERLEKLNEDLIGKSASFRDAIEHRFEEKVLQHEAQFAEKQAAADGLMQAATEKLQQREQLLKEKLATIDDRNNTHVRRDIRDRMLDDVKQRISKFGVSEATEKKRLPVAWGMYLLCTSIVLLIGWTFFEISQVEATGFQTHVAAATVVIPANSASAPAAQLQKAVEAPGFDMSALYWLWARLAVLTLSLFGSIIYYIKWQNRWADQHAANEFQLQQFYIDVNRANWVIESCLEWRKETDSSIPTELLSSITNGLFVNPMSEPERVIHPADELASALMGSASKLKLKVGDGEMEFDKPGKIVNKTAVV
jgi:hypothetical protein